MDDGSDDAFGSTPLDESAEHPAPAEHPETAPAPLEPTGHDDVDRALSAMDGLEQRDVHEHVAVFEEAHAALRRALDRTDP